VPDFCFAAFTLQVDVSAIVASGSKATGEKAPQERAQELMGIGCLQTIPRCQLTLAPFMGSSSHKVYALSIRTADNNRRLFSFAHIVTIVTRRQSISESGHLESKDNCMMKPRQRL